MASSRESLRPVPPPWDGQERRAHSLDEEMIEVIAEKAAEKAVTKLTGHICQEIGKGVVAKILWIAGALAAGLWIYLKQQGFIK